MLKVNNITFSYRRKSKPVFRDLSIEISRGKVYGLLGKNGSGKSTLLNLIAGLLTPDNGEVSLYSVNTRRRMPSTLCDMFLVPEEFTLPPITLKSYIKVTAPFYPGFSRDDLMRHLDTFEMSSDLNLGELSMGQKKKAFLCFALACNTSLLLLDEPTNGLDIPGKSAFRRFIASNMTDERTIIISTHQVRDIDKILDHLIIIGDNGIMLDNSVYDITSRLKFTTATDPATISNALFSHPAIGGASIIVPNLDSEETELNLETLFEFVSTSPDKAAEILNAL